MESSDSNVCVLGLGYVGLTLAVTMADIGFTVQGVEIRDDILEKLSAGIVHFHEPGLQESLQRGIKSSRFRISKRVPSDWSSSVFVVTVGTPLDINGRSRMDMIENVCREIACCMGEGALIIIRSTVKLGVTRKIIAPILAQSGKKFDLAFCPERTLEGKALVELRQLPQIVGGISRLAVVRASQLFQFITPTVVRVSSVEAAEMIKLIDNAQRDVAFAYANEVARACDAVGVSAIEVIQAGKLGYPRTNLPMPGLVGGPCLEKDSHILAEGLRELGVEPAITMAARRTNENQPAEVVGHLRQIISGLSGFAAKPVITLLGIAFKGQPATDDLRGSMSRPVLARLREAFPNAEFHGFDPVVSHADIRCFGLEPVAMLEQAFADSSLVLIMNNHSVFGTMPIQSLTAGMKKPGVVYDFWNLFKTADLHLPQGVIYMALGSHGLANLPVIRVG
jgi:UDP-N-acetyl-D-mannosaminuronic acid dehydrogenase